MELTEKTIENLKILKNAYERKEKGADKAFITNALDILKEEENFKGVLTSEVYEDSKTIEIAEYEDSLKVNVKGLIEDAKRRVDIWENRFYPEERFAVENMYVLIHLLHESSHAWYLNGLSSYDEINRYYRELNIDFPFLTSLLYQYFGYIFSFERHANIEAFKETIRIYQDREIVSILEENYLFNLCYQYGKLSPAKKTFLYYFKKWNFDTEGIPLLQLIEVGFPVEKNIQEAFINTYIEYTKGIRTFEETLEKIKTLEIK